MAERSAARDAIVVTSNRRLVLVDGMAMVYRAFYAIRGLSTKAGAPTNAVFGFIRMLRQLREARNATHIAVLFDGGLPARRLELLEDYKAQRPEMPDPLRQQLPIIEEYLERSRTAWGREEGWEADDLIASMVRWARPDCGRIMIATGDKDLFQMVGGNVYVVPVSGAGEELGREGVREKTGVEPGQIVDWLALTGDASDNIPGVPGVGPKTAASLLARHGSIGRVFEHLSEAGSARLIDSLTGNRELVYRNMEMLRLRDDWVCPFSWEDIESREPDRDRMIPFFREHEFDAMAREMQEPDLFAGKDGIF